MANIILTTFPVVYTETQALPVNNVLTLQTEEIGGTKRVGTLGLRVFVKVGAFQFSEIGTVVGSGLDNNTSPLISAGESITLHVKGQQQINFKAFSQNDSFVVSRSTAARVGGNVIPWWLAEGIISESDVGTIYDPIAAAGLAESYVNLADPGVMDATVGVAPGHTVDVGWVMNGSTHYLIDGLTITNDHTIVIWVEDASGVYIYGTFRNTPYLASCEIRPIASSNSMHRLGAAKQVTGALISSIIGVNKNGALRNGALHSASLGTMAGVTLNPYFGCENQNGTPVSFGGGKIARFAHYTITLSEAQFRAVCISMFSYNQAADHAYKAAALASAPLCLFTLNHSYGSYCRDSKNVSDASATEFVAGVAGKYGNAMKTVTQGAFDDIYIERFQDKFPTFNMDEFSFACWLRLEIVKPTALRLFNCYSNAGSEYFALECRNGAVAIYLNINSTTTNSGTLKALNAEQWYHIVGYHKASTGEYGVYVDGTKYAASNHVLGLYVDNIPDDGHPHINSHGNNSIQNVMLYDNMIDQAKVTSIQ